MKENSANKISIKSYTKELIPILKYCNDLANRQARKFYVQYKLVWLFGLLFDVRYVNDLSDLSVILISIPFEISCF